MFIRRAITFVKRGEKTRAKAESKAEGVFLLTAKFLLPCFNAGAL